MVWKPAALMVLHTWSQRLEHHPHVHALVPGGGPSLDGKHWIKTRHPRHRKKRKPYLIDNKILSECFREKFLDGMERLQRRGELQLCGEYQASATSDPFAALLDELRSLPWNVFIEAPPQDDASPEHVLMYLARYMTGGPISDRRLVSHESGDVTFLARSKDKPTDGSPPEQVPITLSGVEFTRCWAMHILPKGYIKSRRYGGFSNRHCTSYLERCRELLGLGSELNDASQETNDDESSDDSEMNCPQCQSPMICLTSEHARPSWKVVMSGLRRPRLVSLHSPGPSWMTCESRPSYFQARCLRSPSSHAITPPVH